MPGQKPPAHALSTMAGKKVKNGRSSPQIADSRPRNAAAARAAVTAMA